jgi:hypothetical protein
MVMKSCSWSTPLLAMIASTTVGVVEEVLWLVFRSRTIAAAHKVRRWHNRSSGAVKLELYV